MKNLILIFAFLFPFLVFGQIEPIPAEKAEKYTTFEMYNNKTSKDVAILKEYVAVFSPETGYLEYLFKVKNNVITLPTVKYDRTVLNVTVETEIEEDDEDEIFVFGILIGLLVSVVISLFFDDYNLYYWAILAAAAIMCLIFILMAS